MQLRPNLEILTLLPYIEDTGLRARYDAKRDYGISVVDPGAVPGSSTKFASQCWLTNIYQSGRITGGAETGSTRVVKVIFGVRYDTAGVYPEGSGYINANDNFVVANDNNQAVAIAA